MWLAKYVQDSNAIVTTSSPAAEADAATPARSRTLSASEARRGASYRAMRMGLDSGVRSRVYRPAMRAEPARGVSATRDRVIAQDALRRIGDVAAAAGVSVDAIRFYERRGLLRPVRRRASGYREYSPDAVRVVRFIRRAQALGFTLSEVEELVRLRERAWAGDAPRQLRETAATKVGDIDRRVRELLALRDALARLIAACDQACPVMPTDTWCPETSTQKETSLTALDCPLIEALEVEAPEASLDTDGSSEPPRSSRSGRRSTKRNRAPANAPSLSTRRRQ